MVKTNKDIFVREEHFWCYRSIVDNDVSASCPVCFKKIKCGDITIMSFFLLKGTYHGNCFIKKINQRVEYHNQKITLYNKLQNEIIKKAGHIVMLDAIREFQHE